MMDALRRLVQEGSACCSFSSIIAANYGGSSPGKPDDEPPEVDLSPNEGEESGTAEVPVGEEETIEEPASEELTLASPDELNPSQRAAVDSCRKPLALIWGPPGTGKTTVVVYILQRILRTLSEDSKILMTASTHNGRRTFHFS
jgi:hypothetical protein